ncbi:MAG: hypothetical protein JEY99_03835 [Spirochaetales bacterium]|nr:hypothetical protein [Spirochaetales bacterium]
MNYTSAFNKIKKHCLSGTQRDIDQVLSILNGGVDLPTTRAVDYYLSLVKNPEGIEQLKHYIMNGTLIQRNYCTLYFARKNDWDIVNRAYNEGLIDRIQAYSR